MQHPSAVSTGRLVFIHDPRPIVASVFALVVAGLAGMHSPSLIAQTTLESIVVTPTRTARSADETIAPVTVITREDIEATGSSSLPEILRAAAGVELSTNGAYGKATGIFVRGTETDHVLVLVDGVKLYSATLGRSSLELIPVDQIQRIEVLRGPRASLYGAEALGGVVHIFTHDGEAGGSTRLSLGYGADATSDVSAGFTGASDSARYRLSVNRFDTDGIDVTDDAQLDEDSYKNTSLSGGIVFDTSSNSEFGLNVLYSTGDTAFDNTFDVADAVHDSDFDQYVVSASAKLQATSNWTSSLRLSSSEEDRDSFRNKVFENNFATQRSELSWQNDVIVGQQHLMTAGIDYSDDSVDSTTRFEVDSRDNTGVFVQWQGNYDRQGVIVALRHDDNEQFGGQTNGSVDYRFDITPGLRLRAGAGTGFKAPSFNELYFPDFGNPSLDVEKVQSFEIGLQGDVGGGQWTATWFDAEIEDLITFDNATFVPANVAQAQISGLELDYRGQVAGWTISAGVNVLRPEDSATGNTLVRRARTNFRLAAARRFGSLDASAGLSYSGHRFDDAANEERLDSFVLANVSGRWHLTNAVEIETTVENLLDEDYETASGFNERGRTWFIRLHYNAKR